MAFSPDNYSAIADLSVSFAPMPVDDLGADELLAAGADLAEIVRRGQSQAALIAARIAFLSRSELGGEGLAQRLGARTPERLVQNITGTSAREAHTMVRVGTLMATSSEGPTTEAADATPWLSEIAAAVASGRLTLEAADVIKLGLASPSDVVAAESLGAAASQLLAESGTLTLERLAARARQLRAALDLDHVLENEEALRDKRWLRLTPCSDGSTNIAGNLDPESAAIVKGAYDAALSPRRGPRFVDEVQALRDDEIVRDDRTNEQLALDTFVELIRVGTDADSGKVLGSRRPSVQVLVTDADLRARRGFGTIDGQSEPISIETVERIACDSGYVPILFDDEGQGLNLGRDQRYHDWRQRRVISSRDGGCLAFDCDRPPSWCEVHHIEEWKKDAGNTTVEDGVLLCRHHHLLMHNHGWRIIREGGRYFAVPPASRDPEQRPIPFPSKSTTHDRLLATVGAR